MNSYDPVRSSESASTGSLKTFPATEPGDSAEPSYSATRECRWPDACPHREWTACRPENRGFAAQSMIGNTVRSSQPGRKSCVLTNGWAAPLRPTSIDTSPASNRRAGRKPCPRTSSAFTSPKRACPAGASNAPPKQTPIPFTMPGPDQGTVCSSASLIGCRRATSEGTIDRAVASLSDVRTSVTNGAILGPAQTLSR